MSRYFIEVAYDGTAYSGFQIQANANTVQAELEKALHVFYRSPIMLTGSSRTDAGVHARQNFFHFDIAEKINDLKNDVYHINSILPDDVVIREIIHVKNEAHCRFDAFGREYRYYIYSKKNPFLNGRAYLYPYPVRLDLMTESADVLKEYTDFTSFSKRNTQVKDFNCDIKRAEWIQQGESIIFTVVANRFLRGMVKALVGTQLRVGRGKMSIHAFKNIIERKNCELADFSAPSKGLFLEKVFYDWENIKAQP